MDRLRQDIRFAVRSLIKSPLVTAAAVISLALGIGANAAIFSGVDAFLFKPLAFDEADNLVAVWTSNDERGWSSASSSVPDFLDWRADSRTVDMAAYSSAGVNFFDGSDPERLRALQVTTGFFDILRKPPALGRGFRSDEESVAGPRAIILSDGLWRRRFGADPGVLGRVVDLDGEPWEVVGVAAPRIDFGRDPDIWTPFRFSGDEPRTSRYLSIVARVRDGSAIDDARAELSSLAARLASTFPENEGNGVNVLRLQEEWFDEGFRQGSLIAGTAVLFVLLIACANVANLLLARGAARSGEVALRSAIGAGRARIFRQLLTESILLALASGIAAIPLAIIGVRGMQSLFPVGLPGVSNVRLDTRVFVWMALLAVASGVVFGIVPALRQSRSNLRDLISDGGRGNSGGRGGRLRSGLVIAEISVAFVLLVSSVLLVKAFVGLRTADLGFETRDRVTLGVTLPVIRYADDQAVHTFQRALLERLGGLSGVRAVGITSLIPMNGSSGRYYSVSDEPPPEPGREPVVEVRYVSPDYLDAIGVSITGGRAFTMADAGESSPVAIINQRFAVRHWAGTSPIGKAIRFAGVDHEIVGIAEDTRDFGPDDDPPRLAYLPLAQRATRDFRVVIAGPVSTEAIAEPIRAAVRTIDPQQPVYDLSTLEAELTDEVSGSLAMTKVLGSLGIIAFLLSAVGVYGVMAYSVVQRKREVGIRMALGAEPRDVLRLILRKGILISGLGVAIGLALSLAATRALAFFLFGVSPFDPVAFISVPVALGITGLIASAIPAVRATKVDPLVSLRSDG